MGSQQSPMIGPHPVSRWDIWLPHPTNVDVLMTYEMCLRRAEYLRRGLVFVQGQIIRITYCIATPVGFQRAF